MRCKTCNGPMKPLFSGLFCPNDCDRASHGSAVGVDIPSEIFQYGERTWRMAIISAGDEIPKWATHGWNGMGKETLSLKELARKWRANTRGPCKAHVKNAEPGWELVEPPRRSDDMFVFCLA